MVDILGAIPLSVGGIVALLVNALIVFVALVIADKIIAHSIDAKRLLIMSIISLFLAPIVGILLASYVPLPGMVSAYAVPLLVWIILGELLIKEADFRTKLKVIVVGFLAYILLSIFAAPLIFSLLPF